MSLSIRADCEESSWISRAAHNRKLKQKGAIKKIIPFTKLSHDVQAHFISVEYEDGTQEKYDSLIFATGYHSYFPFLDSKLFQKEGNAESFSSRTSIRNLYLHTFYSKDPTLTVLGLVMPDVLFHVIETQAVALAGVYSKIRFKRMDKIDCATSTMKQRTKVISPLPETLKQELWETSREVEVGLKFENYRSDLVYEQLAKDLFNFAPLGRKCPLEVDSDAPNVYEDGLAKLESLFLCELGEA